MKIVFTACTAERFFRVDRAQEHLHYVTDIANEIIYILDQECPTIPQTPEDEISPNFLHQPNASSLSESSDKESPREGTPNSPSNKFFNRSLSGGPGSGGTSDSLSPGVDCPSRKNSQGSQSSGSHGSPRDSDLLDVVGNGRSLMVGNGKTSFEPMVNFKR